MFTIDQTAAAAPEPAAELLGLLPWAALVTAGVALLVAWARHMAEKRDRRRTLYADAYAAVHAWVELVWRVRRRSTSTAPELVEKFHDIQERIAYFRSWLGSESPSLCRSYCAFVAEVKAEVLPLLTEAWLAKPRSPDLGAGDLPVPDVDAASNRFLDDVRDHLSLWVWPRVRIWRRNRPKQEHHRQDPPAPSPVAEDTA